MGPTTNPRPKQKTDLDLAIDQVSSGRKETVHLDLEKIFGEKVVVDYNSCQLVEIEGARAGVWGILSHDLQTLVGVTRNANFLDAYSRM